MVEIAYPRLSEAGLIRELGGARVVRLTTLQHYQVDWVHFAPGQPTPMHDHKGIEHHLVGAGRVCGHYNDLRQDYGPLDYFFWDGRRQHTSYSADDRPAEMMIVRAINIRQPDCDYRAVVVGADAGTISFNDGVGRITIERLTAGQTRVSDARAIILLGESGIRAHVGGHEITCESDQPMAVCRNDSKNAVTIAANASLVWLGLDA